MYVNVNIYDVEQNITGAMGSLLSAVYIHYYLNNCLTAIQIHFSFFFFPLQEDIFCFSWDRVTKCSGSDRLRFFLLSATLFVCLFV